MSIRWVVFGEVVVGEVEAQNRDHAEIAAGREEILAFRRGEID